MKKRILLIALPLSVLIITYLVFITEINDNDILERGNAVIEQIEEYRLKENNLPNDFRDLNLEEYFDKDLYYQKEDSLNYIVWFGTSLGESMIYYSDSKNWENGYRKIGNN